MKRSIWFPLAFRTQMASKHLLTRFPKTQTNLEEEYVEYVYM